MVDMALLVGEASRVEGPQAEFLLVLYGSLYDTVRTNTKLTDVEADRLAMKVLVRLQSRLAAAGFITRDL